MWCISVIALNTFRECLRDKILYTVLIFAVFLIGASTVLGSLTVMEHYKIVTDMGLASINLSGVIIAIFIGISLVSKEIEKRTVYTIMARPITRSQFIVGKFLGLSFTVLVNVGIMFLVFLLTLWLYHADIHLAMFQAVGLMVMELLLVTAIAMFFSTFSSSTLSAIFTIGLYVIGHLTSDLKGIVAMGKGKVLETVFTGIYYICPNLEMFNIKGQAARGIGVSLSYQALASVYGLLYTTLVVFAACMVFQRRSF